MNTRFETTGLGAVALVGGARTRSTSQPELPASTRTATHSTYCPPWRRSESVFHRALQSD